MDGARDRSVVVVGGGVLGLAVAAEAVERGWQVTLVERERELCQAASAASFAWANAHDKTPAAYADLNRRGIARHERSSDAAAADRWFTPLPARVNGERVQLGGTVEVAAFARALAERIRTGGGELRTGAEVRAVASAEPGARVELDTGEALGASAVVIAAGTAAPSLLATLGPVPPVLAAVEGERGFLVRVRSDAVPEEILVSDELSVRPDGRGRLVLQSLAVERRLAADAVHATGATAWPLVRDLARWHGLPLRDADVIEVREAARPLPSDGLPAAGWVAASVYLVLAHSGVTLAPELGALVAAELDGEPQRSLSPFRPDRDPYAP